VAYPAYSSEDPTRPGIRMLAVTKADADLPNGRCRALLVGTAGAANLQLNADDGPLTNVPLQVGYNPLQVTQVRTGGTASDIWAIY
jgi:hypothetical protein